MLQRERLNEMIFKVTQGYWQLHCSAVHMQYPISRQVNKRMRGKMAAAKMRLSQLIEDRVRILSKSRESTCFHLLTVTVGSFVPNRCPLSRNSTCLHTLSTRCPAIADNSLLCKRLSLYDRYYHHHHFCCWNVDMTNAYVHYMSRKHFGLVWRNLLTCNEDMHEERFLYFHSQSDLDLLISKQLSHFFL